MPQIDSFGMGKGYGGGAGSDKNAIEPAQIQKRGNVETAHPCTIDDNRRK